MRVLSEELKTSLRHLAAARFYLPVAPVESPELGTVSQLEQFLHHTEFALAMEELEGLGEANDVGPEFWKELALAAENMGLTEPAVRYRSRMASSPTGTQRAV